ncbi:MAG: GyrI-like domain-containing protein [Defluviitaleaceae bacterium]|nr:GyrI-like domain-containing protein [Defluviitaleaceae bacterium]
MFAKKLTTEVIEIKSEIYVTGLSLENAGFEKKSEKIGELWGMLESAGRKKISDKIKPAVNYGFWYGKPDGGYDYIVGSAVFLPGEPVNGFVTSVIPAGKYIKVSFNAKDFSELVCGDGIRNGFETAKNFAEKNGFETIAMPAGIEAYPHDMMRVGKENGPEWGLKPDYISDAAVLTEYPEMYVLLRVV